MTDDRAQALEVAPLSPNHLIRLATADYLRSEAFSNHDPDRIECWFREKWGLPAGFTLKSRLSLDEMMSELILAWWVEKDARLARIAADKRVDEASLQNKSDRRIAKKLSTNSSAFTLKGVSCVGMSVALSLARRRLNGVVSKRQGMLACNLASVPTADRLDQPFDVVEPTHCDRLVTKESCMEIEQRLRIAPVRFRTLIERINWGKSRDLKPALIFSLRMDLLRRVTIDVDCQAELRQYRSSIATSLPRNRFELAEFIAPWTREEGRYPFFLKLSLQDAWSKLLNESVRRLDIFRKDENWLSVLSECESALSPVSWRQRKSRARERCHQYLTAEECMELLDPGRYFLALLGGGDHSRSPNCAEGRDEA